MATSVQQNLVEKNKEYQSKFKDGDLALPPAKKYTVGKSYKGSASSISGASAAMTRFWSAQEKNGNKETDLIVVVKSNMHGREN